MEKGVYCLVLFHGPCTIRVGALGDLAFPGGWHVYTGSAQGPGGLKRVQRHISIAASRRQTKRWHIDYLLGIRRGYASLCRLCTHNPAYSNANLQMQSVGSRSEVSGAVTAIAVHTFFILIRIRSIRSWVRWFQSVLTRSSQQSIPSRDSVD